MSDLSMKPSRDELVERRGPARRPPAGKKNDGGGGIGTKVLVVVLFSMALGAAGYLWIKVQELNSVLEQSLRASQEQLGTLESKVNTQDKSLSMTGDKVTSSINHLNSEVRKLWDLSNKRNRTDIDALQKTVQALQAKQEADAKSRAELAAQLSQSQNEVKTLKANLAKLQEDEARVKDLQDTIASLKSEQADLAATQASLAKQQQALDGKVSKQQTQLAAVGKTPAVPDVSRRIADVEADILSINAHRQQVNSRLNQLDQDIQGLYQRR